ncbi:MAG: hypothetical protein ACE14M_09985 [Terriglobales bacterium]
MDQFTLLAQPWWVNLLIAVPFVSWSAWRRNTIRLDRRVLLAGAAFGMSFGFVEAAVVVYLRAAIGLLPGYQGNLADVRRLSVELYRHPIPDIAIPASLLTTEVLREAATIMMLLAVALLAARTHRERWAMFLWCFAFWDIIYYVGLWATVGWPYSLLAPDVLFLIPTPWIAQVWFPILVSGLSIVAVLAANNSREHAATTGSSVRGVSSGQ